MNTQLQAALGQLGNFAGTDQPFLTVYADLMPQGNGQRPAIRQIEQELERIVGELNLHDVAREQLLGDQQRIVDYIEREVPREAAGAAIFACAAENAWMALPLYAPVETYVAVGPTPHAFQLARIADDYETFALVVAEGQQAQIYVVASNRVEHVAETEAAEKIKRFEAGGQAQMIFQRRTDNVIKAHLKDLSSELERVVDQQSVDHIIISSNDAIKGMVQEQLAQRLQAMVVEYINFDPHAGNAAMMDTLAPIMQRVEREQEQQLTTDLANEVGANARGVAGLAETALALSKGQVRVLVLHRTFQALGRTNPTTGFLYAPGYLNDPYDGSELSEIDLREAFVSRALGQGAMIEVVDDSDYLAEHDGVGALLHYRDDLAAKQAGSR
ncbi:MAG: hypothetical protein H7Z42_09885 [Roseiflexaceae bacterium]|nr:hypothetical protein [Roseiflexaceae bacterium]